MEGRAFRRNDTGGVLTAMLEDQQPVIQELIDGVVSYDTK
jgi:hypothetical protein